MSARHLQPAFRCTHRSARRRPLVKLKLINRAATIALKNSQQLLQKSMIEKLALPAVRVACYCHWH
jgi:hypothetical protein